VSAAIDVADDLSIFALLQEITENATKKLKEITKNFFIKLLHLF
jgi:hypothetical protein